MIPFPFEWFAIPSRTSNVRFQTRAPVRLFQLLNDPQALRGMIETLCIQFVEDEFARVTEGSVAQIVRQRNRLGQVFVQKQRPRHRSPNLGNLEGVGEARTVMISLRSKKYLRLPLQTAKCFRVDDAVPIPLIGGSKRVFRLRVGAPPAVRYKHRVGAESLPFPLLDLLMDGHRWELTCLWRAAGPVRSQSASIILREQASMSTRPAELEAAAVGVKKPTGRGITSRGCPTAPDDEYGSWGVS